MSTSLPTSHPSPPVLGEPAWDVALLYPPQGSWSEAEYLELADHSNKLIEFTDGVVEVLTMPTVDHQLIVKFLLKSLDSFIEPRGLGVVLFAPLPVRANSKSKIKYREPDLIFNFAERHAQSDHKHYQGADLVMEVVSDDRKSHVRDYETKIIDYAQAGITEYWIVDPQLHRISVMALEGEQYVAHGVFERGQIASSRLLDGFTVDVDAVFAAGRQ